MNNNSDLYGTLNLTKDASQDEIKKAFRKLAMENHPDKHNGDKEKEAAFKKITEAYNVLSDPEKKKAYDQFGVVDGSMPTNIDVNDMLRNMFGGGDGGGVSFMFMDGDDGGFNNIFQGIPGFPGFQFPGRKKQSSDIVDINVDICDLYYGTTKRAEFELLDMCEKCKGTGAYDTSQIVNCITCNGQGVINQQVGPFFMQRSTCPSCIGKGQVIKKPCASCRGEKVVYAKRKFELKLPKGLPNGHEITMEKKGSYNIATKTYKDITFRFKHHIEEPYKLDSNNNVHFNINIDIADILAGFKKQILIYKDLVTIQSHKYFNPSEPVIIKGKGLPDFNKQKLGDLYIHFNVQFSDSERLKKYNYVFQKILKKNKEVVFDKESSETIVVQDLV